MAFPWRADTAPQRHAAADSPLREHYHLGLDLQRRRVQRYAFPDTPLQAIAERAHSVGVAGASERGSKRRHEGRTEERRLGARQPFAIAMTVLIPGGIGHRKHGE